MKKFLQMIFWTTVFLMPTAVLAQADPTQEINSIVEKLVTMITQVGSGVLLLFIVFDAFKLLKDHNQGIPVGGGLTRDISLLFVAVMFLFKPDFILDAVKFIANV